MAGKLSNIVRSVARKDASPRSSSNTPLPWDPQTQQAQQPQAQAQPDDLLSTHDIYNRNSRENPNRDSRDSQRMRIERLGIGNAAHGRNDSGHAPSNEYGNESNGPSRKHDYDLHAMETSVGHGHIKDNRSAIPTPSVTVRSEFPTLNRSRQQQSLTCIVTIEVPEARWSTFGEDGLAAPPVPPLPSDHLPSQGPTRQRYDLPEPFIPYESQEVLEEVTEELRVRVDNWHGLEFQRFVSPKGTEFLSVC